MPVTFYRFKEERSLLEKIECPVCLESLAGKTSLRHDLPAFAEERMHPHCSDCIGQISELSNKCSLCNREIKEIESCCPFATNLKTQSAKVIRYLRSVDYCELFGGIFMGSSIGAIAGSLTYQLTNYVLIYGITVPIGALIGPFIYKPIINVAERMLIAFERCFQRRGEAGAQPPV